MATSNKLVLVADDYDHAAALLAEFLTIACAFDTMIAKDGREAICKALARKPDAAILDIDMPHVGGIEAALAMRRAFCDRPPLLIALTGGSPDKAALSGVFDHVLVKPTNVEKLLLLLQDV